MNAGLFSMRINVALIITLLPICVMANSLFGSGTQTKPIEPILIPIGNSGESFNFHMGKYEVSVAEFQRFINATGYQVPENCMVFSAKRWPSSDNLGSWNSPDVAKSLYNPAVCIGVNGALAYINWLVEKTGKPYRLPDSAEWEFAAFGGSENRLPFGKDYSQSQICKYENTEDIASVIGIKKDHKHNYRYSTNCNDGATYQTVIGMYRPNIFGLHDMLGNVREITQSCRNKDANNKSCQRYDVKGGAWHWQFLGDKYKDTIETDFNGSLEGFRIVLEQIEPISKSAETITFQHQLNSAQIEARKQHALLKSFPSKPQNLFAKIVKEDNIKLFWQPVSGDDITYSIYRSIIDPTLAQGRQPTLIAKNIKDDTFTDSDHFGSTVTYQVYSHSKHAQSIPSNEVSIGEHKVYTKLERIQAEHFKNREYAIISKHGKSMSFSANPYHLFTSYPPYLPASLDYLFHSEHRDELTLTMRIRGEAGAKLEIWQGQHLVSRVNIPASKEFALVKTNATLVASQEPLEIRAAEQKWFELDWFEFAD